MNTCTSCGHQFESGMFFCDKCGARFVQHTPPPAQQPAQQNEQQNKQQLEQKLEQQVNFTPCEIYRRGSRYYKEGDYTNAEKWFRKAAEKGDSKAQFYMGVIYHYGQGVPKDYEQAIEWYGMSATQGMKNARQNLDVLSSTIAKMGKHEESSHIITVTRKKSFFHKNTAEDFCIDFGKSIPLLGGESATVEVSTDIVIVKIWCEAYRAKYDADVNKQLALKLTDKNVNLLFWWGYASYQIEVTGAVILGDINTLK